MNYLNRLTIHKLSSFCVYTSFLTLLIGLISLTLGAEEAPNDVSQGTPETHAPHRKVAENPIDSDTQKTADSESAEEEINGTAEHLERHELQGITILTGNVEILRTDGYLNADKVTFYTDTETGETIRTVAEGNVEIRDADIFATSDHATMEHVKNMIILEHNVVVLQNKDRLETALFKFNRTTGKQTGEGGVKFKVRIKQAEPIEATADSAAAAADGARPPISGEEKTAPAETEDAGTGEEKTAPAETEDGARPPISGEEKTAPVDADADADTDAGEADTEKETAPAETEEEPEAEADDTAPTEETQ